MKTGECLPCSVCKGMYDVSKANRKSELKKESEIKCPYCGYIVAWRLKGNKLCKTN